MNPTPDLWLALHSVTRWHTNPHLARMGQTVADHTAGMLALGLQIWPDMPRNLMVAIIHHDAAESVVGDVPYMAKQDPALKNALDIAEDRVLRENGWELPAHTDGQRLKFLDRLEAYRFALLHAPQIMQRDGWPEATQWIMDEAEWLKVDVSRWMPVPVNSRAVSLSHALFGDTGSGKP